MVNSKINYIISIFMIICLIIVGITSIMMENTERGNGSRHNIIFIHHTFGVIFLVLIILHVILHLKWITAMTKKFFGRKNN